MIESTKLNTLNTRMAEAQTLPPQEALALWRHLGRQVAQICTDLETADPRAAHATLPALAEMIDRLNATIVELEKKS